MALSTVRMAQLTGRYLTHTCTLTTPGAASGHDAYQEAIPGAPTTVTGVACFATQGTGPGRIEEPGRALVAHDWRILVPVGAAIAEGGTVGDVRDEAGALLVAGPLTVAETERRAGHITLLCDEATNGAGQG